MIVRDAGDGYQIVFQTDHATLSGQLAERWGNERFARPEPFEPMKIAAFRHDDGWSVWERAPRLDDEGRPQNFLDRDVAVHLHLYRAAIAAVSEEDRYAGLLVSMHGAGLYKGRYAGEESPPLTGGVSAQDLVDEFVREQEAYRDRLAEELGLDETRLWTNYRLLQVYDRLSLYFCMNDLEGGEPASLEDVPVDYSAGRVDLELAPAAPWRVRAQPFPFGESPSRFTLLRRLVLKRDWPDHESFRRDLFSAEPEVVEITVESG